MSSPRRLLATKPYRCIDEELAALTLQRIRQQFESLFAAQGTSLPADTLAAGQYLDQPGFNQRGLFGTAAAILAIARAGKHDPDALITLQKLINYLHQRPSIESHFASAPDDAALLRRRLETEEIDSFKNADVLYALAQVPAAVEGREAYMQMVLRRIEQARRPTGGWGTRLAPDAEFDALATGHILRALVAAAMPYGDSDVSSLVDYVTSNGSLTPTLHTRCFVLLVLHRTDRHLVGPELLGATNNIIKELRTQMRDPAEANYEYTIGNRQYYVRIPWQLYLLELVARIHPWRFFHHVWQSHLLQVVGSVSSPR